MKKVLIVHGSRTGNTEKMAQYIAEGIRMAGHEAIIKKISDVKKPEDLEGYHGYVFGCPTYHKDMTPGMKQFLFLAENVNLVGKVGGAFGSHTHSGEAAPMVYDTMKFVFKMDMIDLGPLNLREAIVNSDDGLRACQDYGKEIGKKLG